MTPIVNAVLVSLERRAAARALTVPQLLSAGIRVHEHLDDGTHERNGHIGLQAVRHAIRAGWEWALIVEDDIDLASDLPMFLRAAMRQAGCVTYFYLNDQPRSIRHLLGEDTARSVLAGEPQARRLQETRWYWPLFGTQCTLVPASLLPIIRQRLEGGTLALDRAVQEAVAVTSARVLIAVPHPVQHRHDRTGRPSERGIKKHSLSFELARVGDSVSVTAQPAGPLVM